MKGSPQLSFRAVLIGTHEGTRLSLRVPCSSLFSDESVLWGTRSLLSDQEPDSASVETEGDSVNYDFEYFGYLNLAFEGQFVWLCRRRGSRMSCRDTKLRGRARSRGGTRKRPEAWTRRVSLPLLYLSPSLQIRASDSSPLCFPPVRSWICRQKSQPELLRWSSDMHIWRLERRRCVCVFVSVRTDLPSLMQ